MKRPLRRLLLVLLLPPVLAFSWLTFTESGLRWGYQQAEPYLPGKLTLAKLEGRLFGSITAKGIEYLQDGAQITANQLALEWLPVALLTAKIDITRLHLETLNVVLPQSEKAEHPERFSLPEINLPWRLILKNVLINGLSISLNGQSYDLQQIRLNATTLFSQVDIDELTIAADDFSLNIEGELQPTGHYHHELDMHWQVALATKAVVKGNGQLAGDIKTSRINQQLSGPLQLTLNAELNDLLKQFNWQANIDVTEFDASKLNSDWPTVKGILSLDGKGDLSTASVVGNVKAKHPEYGPFDADLRLQRLSDNSIQFDHLMLHSPVNETRIHGRGQWLPGDDGGDVTVALNWQNLRWPLTDTAWFDSAVGSGWIAGNINQYRLGLATDRPWPQAPASLWYASAQGNLNGLNFDSLRITTLDGEATAKGQLAWSPQLVWQAQLSASDINPASLLPEWPGQLETTLTSNGRIENGQLIAAADISKLTGILRGYPISLRSGFDWRDNGININHFDFHSGTSQVNAQGRIGESLNLNIAIVASDLAELYPHTKGQLKAEGQLTGSRSAPLITTSFKAAALHLPDYDIASLDGTVAVDLFSWQQVDIKLAAETLKFKDYALQSLVIDADTRQIKAKAISKDFTAQVELIGEVDDKGWHGRIEQADIKSDRFADWQLKHPVKLSVSDKSLLADELCWQSNQEAKLCASLKHEDEWWQSQLVTSKLPLMLLSPLLSPDLELEGVADATAELKFQAPDQLMGQAQIDLPAGAINYPLLIGERDRWQYQSGKGSIRLNDQGLQANAEIAINNGDRFNARLSLPGAKLLVLDQRNQPLQASAQLKVHDLGLFEAMVPEVYDLRGEVNLSLAATGTLAQPRLSGQAHLLNGALRIPRLGLNIDQIILDSQSNGLETLNFQLGAHSGEGDLAIQGQTTLDRHTGWPTVISIKGEEFEVSRIPEARVLLSPDLQLKLKNRKIDITGKVHIPYAKLQPKDVTTAARVSADTVIIGDEQAIVDKWSIVSKVRLTLGERVYFYGFGFEGRLGGSLLLEDEPGQLTAATGEITIPEGRYRAYGQRLDVEDGRLLYTGGPLSNPGLDLRAVRNVGNVTAGLKVGGSFNQPKIDLFSIPAMGQTDTLAYLLLGHPIENTSDEEGAMMAKAVLALGLSGGDRLARSLGNRFGLDEMRVESSDGGDQASLVMGRYLSPKLYVSYGVGLIEAINTFNVRYQISDKLQLKGESGEHQGADFLYTIER